jgi:hypothetical protein
MKIAIKDHGIGEMNYDVYAETLAVWEAFFLFKDDVTRGCDDNEPQVVDNLGAQFMAAYLEVAADCNVTSYMHIMACHMGDLVRQ